MRLLFTLGLLLGALAVHRSAQAQTSQVNGRITDATNSAVQNAVINLTNSDLGFQREAVSNEQGLYTIPLLPRGTYEMHVQKDGFRPVTRGGVVVDTAAVVSLDFQLELGTVASAVTVEASAPLFDATRGAVGDIVDNKRVLELRPRGIRPRLPHTRCGPDAHGEQGRRR